jgi:hypothetical protein
MSTILKEKEFEFLTKAAEEKNAENLLVLKGNIPLAYVFVPLDFRPRVAPFQVALHRVYGMSKTLEIFSRVLDMEFPYTLADFDKHVASIDPDWHENAKKRWAAKGWGLNLKK